MLLLGDCFRKGETVFEATPQVSYSSAFLSDMPFLQRQHPQHVVRLAAFHDEAAGPCVVQVSIC